MDHDAISQSVSVRRSFHWRLCALDLGYNTERGGVALCDSMVDNKDSARISGAIRCSENTKMAVTRHSVS